MAFEIGAHKLQTAARKQDASWPDGRAAAAKQPEHDDRGFILQRAAADPRLLSPRDTLRLHSVVGNRAVAQLMAAADRPGREDTGVGGAGHAADCGCPACGGGATQVQAQSGERADSSPVIQRQCDTCGNPFCDDGSVCGGRDRKYQPGTHGFKTSEQKRLTSEYGMKVSGSTHESEHTVGFEPLNQTSGLSRGSKGRAHDLEFQAPAYQEVKALHRDHIGTGTKGTPDESGFDSHSYRSTQRSLLESGDISSAVQINQLGYAHNPDFQSTALTTEGKVASDSFNVMVGGMDSFTYANGTQDMSVDVNPVKKAEMIAARRMAELQRQLTPEELGEIYEMVGMNDYWK